MTTSRSSPPVFNDQYFVEGVISLPYAELREPFTAYFDGQNNRSRIDYYADLMQTVQRADIQENETGISYKLAYMVDTAGEAQKVCFQVNGSAEVPVDAQSVLPDLSPFSNIGTDHCPDLFGTTDEACERWEYTMTVGDKQNRYVFWLQRDGEGNPIPVHYLMMGYDSLLGSHYDKYELSYKNYQAQPINPAVFDVSSNYTCRSFPGSLKEALIGF